MSSPEIARTRRQAPAAPAGGDLDDRALYFNRELSWVEFNERVLELAEDPGVPLLERAKFAAIYTSNLDEFFMVRVAGLQEQVDAGVSRSGPDGRTPSETIDGIRERVGALGERLCSCLERQLRPALGEHGIRLLSWDDLGESERAALSERFHRQIFPVLTPLAVGVGRPFPYISNLSLSLAVRLRDPVNGQRTFARVKVPKEVLPRFVAVAEGETTFVPLEEVIAEHLSVLFPGMEILDHSMFRVTRDADFTVSDEADDLLEAVEAELRRRRFGEIVRVEVGAGMPEALRDELASALGVEAREVYEVQGPLDLNDLWQIVELPGFGELREAPWLATRASDPTCSGRCAKATCWSTTPTTRSQPRWSASSSRPSPTPTCSRSSRPCTAPATTRRWCRRSSAPRSRASRRCAWWSSRPASTSGPTSSGRGRWRRRACTWSTAIRA